MIDQATLDRIREIAAQWPRPSEADALELFRIFADEGTEPCHPS